jgi:hypothetical protein
MMKTVANEKRCWLETRKKRLGSDLADLSIKLERVLLIWGVDKKLERVYSKM